MPTQPKSSIVPREETCVAVILFPEKQKHSSIIFTHKQRGRTYQLHFTFYSKRPFFSFTSYGRGRDKIPFLNSFFSEGLYGLVVVVVVSSFSRAGCLSPLFISNGAQMEIAL